MANEVRIQVDPTRYEVVPGEPFDVVVHVYNATDIIDGFEAVLLGLDPEWAYADETPLSLFPDTEGDLTLTIELPRVYPSGDHEIGVKIQSTTDAEILAVQVITMAVASAESAYLAVDPQAVTGGKTGRFALSLHNEGNTTISASIRGTDPEKALEIEFEPESVEVQPGERADLQASAKGKRPWIGSPVSRIINFETVGTGEPLQTVASFVQKARIPRALLVLLILLLVLGAWAAIVAFGLDKILQSSNATAQQGLFVVADGVALEVADEQQAAIDEAVAEAAAEEAAEEAEAAAQVGTISGTVLGEGLAPPQLAGATVTVFTTDDDRTEAIEPEAEFAAIDTGDDGTYVLAELPTGRYKIRFTGPGFAEGWFDGGGLLAPTIITADPIRVEADAGEIDVDATMIGLPGTVAGTITDAVTGAPLPGVLVSLEALGPVTAGGEAVAVSAAEAGFQGAAGASATTAVFSPGGATAVTGLAPVQSRFALLQQPPTFPAPAGSDATDADGNFRIDGVATPRTLRMTLTSTGFQPATLVFPLGAGESLLELSQSLDGTPGSISGTVFDGLLAPLGGVTVVIAGGDTEITLVTLTSPDADVGDFTAADLPPADYTLTFTKEGFVTEKIQVTLAPAAEETLTVVLDGGAGSVSGEVTSNGQPLGGVEVTFTAEDGTTYATVTASEPTPEAAVGTYTIRGLPTPGTLSARFAKEGFVPGFLSVALRGSENRPDVDVALERGGTVSGLVLDRLDDPIDGVEVLLRDSEGATRTAFTQSDGTFSMAAAFETPPPYTITYRKAGFVTKAGPSVEDVPADQNVPLDPVTLVGEPGSIEGFVHKPAGPSSTTPLDGFTVRIVEGTREVASGVFSSTDGAFQFIDLPTPGNYVVQFRRSGFQEVDRVERLEAGQSLDLATITLGVVGSIEGTVDNRLGERLAGATVTVTGFNDPNVVIAPDDISPVTTNSSGEFLIENVPFPGTYTLTVSLENYESSVEAMAFALPVPGGGAYDFGFIELDGEGGVLTGTVLSNVFGDPLEGIDVVISDVVAQPGTLRITNANGKYTFNDLETPAEVVLTVGAGTPGYQPFTSTVIRIGAGGTVQKDVLLGFLGSSISGTVTCGTGSDLSSVSITLTPAQGTSAIVPNSEGQYFFAGLPGSTSGYTVDFFVAETEDSASITIGSLQFPSSVINQDVTLDCG